METLSRVIMGEGIRERTIIVDGLVCFEHHRISLTREYLKGACDNWVRRRAVRLNDGEVVAVNRENEVGDCEGEKC